MRSAITRELGSTMASCPASVGCPTGDWRGGGEAERVSAGDVERVSAGEVAHSRQARGSRRKGRRWHTDASPPARVMTSFAFASQESTKYFEVSVVTKMESVSSPWAQQKKGRVRLEWTRSGGPEEERAGAAAAHRQADGPHLRNAAVDGKVDDGTEPLWRHLCKGKRQGRGGVRREL